MDICEFLITLITPPDLKHHLFCTYVLKFWIPQFLLKGRCMGNFRSSTEKTPILWIWLRKRLFCKICWKNTIPQIVCKKNVFKLNKMLCFLRKKKCPFAAVCDFPTIILYISERLMCLQLRMFVHFFSILWSVSCNLCLCLWLYVCLCFFVCLFVVARPAHKWCELCLVSCLFRFHVSHCLYGERNGAD